MKKLALFVSVWLVVPSHAAFAQNALDGARTLYTSAAYEEALGALGKLQASGPSLASADIEALRAFCLLALRRDDEARTAIQDVITERPTYVPSEDEASPRVRDAFREVRRKLLPAIARDLYQSARGDYEKHDLATAAAKFSDLSKILADPDMTADQTIADLRLLAEGFRTLVAAGGGIATQASASQAAAGGSSATRQAEGIGAMAPGGTPVALPITPPVAINQELPPWRGDLWRQFTGAIDLVIDEQGHVESVSLRKSVHPLYDADLLRAAKSWTYQPARRGNQLIKFQKTLVVKLNSR